MCKIKATISPGLISSERVARFTATGGASVEVIVSKAQVTRNLVEASKIASDQNSVLVELPRESTSGDWRVWVDKKLVKG